MDEIITFLRTNWAFISPPLMLLMGGAGWLINRRVTRAARRVDEVQKTMATLDTSLERVRVELDEWMMRFNVRGQAIKEATPDRGVRVFRREQELLEARARKDNREAD